MITLVLVHKNHLLIVTITQDLVQLLTPGENNSGGTLPVSQLEQGGALVPLTF